MNQDESTFEIPDYILSRLQPTLTLKFPSREDEKNILQYHLPFCADDMLAMTVDFLQNSHELKLDFSTRDGINLLRYAMKRMAQETDHPLAADDAWREALEKCLGEEALDLERLSQQRNQTLGGQAIPMGLGDFFFSPDDPLLADLEDDNSPRENDVDDDDLDDEKFDDQDDGVEF